MLIYSKGKGRRIYHTEQCPYSRRIRKENIGMFQTAEEAAKKGYYGCAYCSKAGKAFRMVRAKVEKFCQETGYTCGFRKGRIFVKTPVDRWLIFCFGEKGKFQIYHENHGKHDEVSKIKGYHRQKWHFISIYDTLLSIYDHTSAYLKKANIPGHVKGRIYAAGGKPGTMMSRRTKGKKKRKEKSRQKRRDIKCVLDLIDQIAENGKDEF